MLAADTSSESWYQSLQDHYYNFMDSLERLGLPVYEYFVEPLEGQGVPSFPVAVLLLLALGAVGLWLILPPGSVDLHVTIVSTDGQSVADAQVVISHSAGQVLQTAQTDAQGLAILTGLPAQLLKLKVSKEGFEPKERTVDPARDPVQRISLVPLEAAPTPEPTPTPTPTPSPDEPPTQFENQPVVPTLPTMAKLTLTIKDKATGRLVNASHVKLFNAQTDVVLGEGDTRLGIIEFANLSVGTQAYVTLRAPGYAPYENKATPYTLTPLTPKIIQLEVLSADALAISRVRTLDAATNASKSARVWVLTLSQSIVNETLSPGEVSFQLIRNQVYQTLAYTPGFLPARRSFAGGADVSLPLVRSNSNNSAILQVKVRNRATNQLVPNASVSMYTELSEFLFAPKPTNAQGLVSFNDVPRGERVRVRGSHNQTVGEVLVDVNASLINIELFLEPIREDLTVVVVQAGSASPQALSNATVEFW